MVAWVEEGKPVDYLVATQVNFSQDALSAKFGYTRKLCPVSALSRCLRSSLSLSARLVSAKGNLSRRPSGFAHVVSLWMIVIPFDAAIDAILWIVLWIVLVIYIICPFIMTLIDPSSAFP